MIGAIDRRARSVGLAGGMDCRWIFERAEVFGKRLWRDRRSAQESFQPELRVVADERLQKRRWLRIPSSLWRYQYRVESTAIAMLRP